MAEAELQARLRQLEQENAALQEQLTRSCSSIESTPALAVSRVAIKLPSFWRDRPALWFAQAEAQFDIAGITADSTKFNYIISQLDEKVVVEVEDIISNPPAPEQKYSKLKYELIHRLSMSEGQRVRQLINEEDLGDRRPSQFLRHLRSLAGTVLTDEKFLCQLWMRRLPASVQVILAAQSGQSLDKLADLADKVSEITASQSVYSIAPAQQPALEKLQSNVEELALQVSALVKTQQRSQPSNKKSSSRQINGETSKLCWYHKKFGTKATRCTQPCSWESENSPGSQ